MNTIDDGGPAFPIDMWEQDSGEYIRAGGMRLRDYFAAKAMQSLIPIHHEMEISFAITADDAYRMADAMIATRKVQP